MSDILSLKYRFFNLLCITKTLVFLQPKTNDRLGFSLLKLMNQVPIGKWLWRIVEANDLRAKVITAKYVVSRNGWVSYS